MKINTNTKIYFSISSQPSDRGSKLHNFLFDKFSKNSIYFPLSIKNLKLFLLFVKEIKAGGFSVSMPFKKKIIKYLSIKSKEVKITKVCNTVILKNDKLIGYNTDYIAVFETLKKMKKFKNKKIQILGYGATTKTVLIVLKKLGFNKIFVYSRKKIFFKSKIIKFFNWRLRNKEKYEILINTTPIGMNIKKVDKSPIDKKNITEKKLILDFPIPSKKKTDLYVQSKTCGIKYISGEDLHFLQGINQAQIYLKKKIGNKTLTRVKKKFYK